MTAITNISATLRFFVPDLSTVLATYTHLRWYRSVDGPNGTFVEKTGSLSLAASLLTPNIEPHALNGTQLILRVNGITEVTVTFASADPVSSADAAAEIAAASALITAADEGGRIRISTIATGSGASLEVLDGDANTPLGFVEGDGEIGLDLDNILLVSTEEYLYTDQNSSSDYWYKTQYINPSTGAVSLLSAPFPAITVNKVSIENTIVAYIKLADLSGNPIEGRKITLRNAFVPNTADGFGIFRHAVEMITDENGYAEIRLVRGLELDISVEGTGFTRRIAIPLLGSSIDLLSPTLVTRDEFGIQEMDVDFAVRTS